MPAYYFSFFKINQALFKNLQKPALFLLYLIFLYLKPSMTLINLPPYCFIPH